jgi:hypothetical protein
MTDTPPMSQIIALRSLDVDGVRIDDGTHAEIRAELVPALLTCGAVEIFTGPGVEAPDTLPGGATPDSAGASPVDAAEGGVAPEAPGEPAPSPAEADVVPGGAADAPAAAAPVTRKGKRA